jgi:hypothetical protein
MLLKWVSKHHQVEKLVATNIWLMITPTAVNSVETLASMENHKKNIDKFAEKPTKQESVEEIEMPKDMVSLSSLVNLEPAWTPKLVLLKFLKSETFLTSTLMAGLTGNSNHSKI